MNILLKIIWRVSDILNVVATVFSCVIKKNTPLKAGLQQSDFIGF
jgi:hypothetical protein